MLLIKYRSSDDVVYNSSRPSLIPEEDHLQSLGDSALGKLWNGARLSHGICRLRRVHFREIQTSLSRAFAFSADGDEVITP